MIYVLVGPSGSGKTSVQKALKDKYKRFITTTTRLPREGEIDKTDYIFVSDQTFNSLTFLETTHYCGHRYGIQLETVVNAIQTYRPYLAILDKHGAQTLKRLYPTEVRIIHIKMTASEMLANMRKDDRSNEEIINRLVHAIDNDEFSLFSNTDYVVKETDLNKLIQLVDDMIGITCNGK